MLCKRTRRVSTRFHLVLVRPSHYDDDGYPIQWVKAAIPSNTLACLNGLAEDARQREVLGPAIDIMTRRTSGSGPIASSAAFARSAAAR